MAKTPVRKPAAAAAATKPARKAAITVPTRATRLHNKSTVDDGASKSQAFEVIVTNRQPEQFACYILEETEHSFFVRRKKGSGSSKQLEVMIPRSDVIEVTGAAGQKAVMVAMSDCVIRRLRNQKVAVDKFGMWKFTDVETGEVTRIQKCATISVSVVGEDVKAPASAAKAPRLRKVA